jgi:hypothetical protein
MHQLGPAVKVIWHIRLFLPLDRLDESFHRAGGLDFEHRVEPVWYWRDPRGLDECWTLLGRRTGRILEVDDVQVRG